MLPWGISLLHFGNGSFLRAEPELVSLSKQEMQLFPWQSWFERLSPWKSARPAPRDRGFARLSLRRLEERRVLDAAAVAPPPVQITEDAGAVVINAGPADGQADVFKVLREEVEGKELLQVSVNGNVVFNKDLDQVASITINGSSDAESLIVDFGGGDPVPMGGIHFAGGTTGGADSIALVNGQVQTVSYSFSSANDGQIQVGSGGASTAIEFSGNVQSVRDSLASDSRSFTFGGTVADVGLTSSSIINTATLNIAETTQVQFGNPTGALALQDATTTGLGMTVSGYTASPQASLSIAGTSQTQLHFVGDTNLSGGSLQVSAGIVHVDGTIVTSSAALEISASQSMVVSSAGQLSSTAGSVLLSSPDLQVAGAIFARDGGAVRLDAGSSGTLILTGEIDATSATRVGGSVDLLGNRVGLTGGAVVDVSGATGGGAIRIGGDWHGNNPNISNALRTYVDQNVSLRADALQSGNGGKIVVWSDDYTVFYAQLSARGGATGGDGGDVEISGRGSLVAQGNYDLSATQGNAGTILFDPLSIVIVGGSADGSDQGNSSGTVLQNNPGSNTLGSILFADEGAGSPAPFVIYESEIEGSTASVILEARQSITTSGTFTNSDVALQTNRSLTLRTRNADGDGAGGIDLTGSTDGANLLFRTQGTGVITIQAATAGAQTGDIVLGRLQTASRAIQVSTGAGSITLNGQVLSGAFTATATGGITIAGPLTASADLQLTAANGVTINGLVSAATTKINADSNADGQGAFILGATAGLRSVGGNITIISGDVDIQSAINAGTGNVSLQTTAGRTMALGNAAAQYTLSGTELSRITAGNLTFGGNDNGNMTVGGVTSAQSGGISGLVTLQASEHAQQITVAGGSSTFSAVRVNAANGIFVRADITTTAGELGLDADFVEGGNGHPDGFDRLVFSSNVTLNCAGYLTLYFCSGGQSAEGALTLIARDGMFLKENLTVSGPLSINADSDGDGNGALTTLSSIRTTGFSIAITAGDLNLGSLLNSGTAAMTISATAGRSVGIGAVTSDFSISEAELSGIRAGSLQIETAGSIAVADVTAAQSQNIAGGLSLLATGIGSDLTFSGNSNTFRSLSGFARDAITVNSSILTTNGALRLESSNSLIVNAPLSTGGTTGGVISIVGGVQVNAGLTARSYNITLITGTQLDLIIDADRISATSLILTAPRDIIVKAIVQTTSPTADIQLIADTDHDGSGGVWIQQAGQVISGRDVLIEGSNLYATGGLGGPLDSIRIDADGANAQVTAAGNITLRQSAFAPAGSDTIIEGRVQATGAGSLDISAKNHIQLASTLSTVSGQISLHAPVVLTGNSQLTSVSGAVSFDDTIDGDTAGSRSLTIDTAGTVLFSGAVGSSNPLAALNVTKSASISALGTIDAASASFTAANGILLARNVTVATPLDINADSNGDGSGTFSLGAGAVITTAGTRLSITAADVDLAGSVNSGLGIVELLVTNCRTVGIGQATGQFTLSGAELSRITAATLRVGGTNSGTISVDGVTATQSQKIGLVELDAGCPAAELRFIGSASTFQVISGTALGAIAVSAPVKANTIRLVGQSNLIIDASLAAVSPTGTIDLTAGTVLLASTLESEQGSVTIHSPVVLTADSAIETRGGAIQFASVATINSAPGEANDLQLTAGAGDVVLGGAVGGSAPLGALTVTDSNSITAVDLAVRDLSLSARGSIALNGNVSTTGPAMIHADSEGNQTGEFSFASGKHLVTNGNLLSITAADVDLQGTLSSGAGEMQFHASTPQATIGAGDGSADFSVSNAEIGRIINTTGLVSIGDADNAGGISIARDETFNVGGLDVAFVTAAGIRIGNFDLRSSAVLSLTADADGNGTGAITSGSGTVSADLLVLSAAEGISLSTAAGILDARNLSTGDIVIHEVDDLDLRRVDQEAGGKIGIDAGGTLRVLGGEPGVSAGDGAIVLKALGNSATLVVDSTVKTNAGPIQLLSDGDVRFGSAGEVQSVSGDVLVVADNAAGNSGRGVQMADGALIDAGRGAITLLADGDITLGRLRSTSAGGAAVRVVTTSGGIGDAGDTLGPDVIAPTALFSAATGIGDEDPLDTSVGTLAATNGTIGSMRFRDVSGETLTIGTVDGVSGLTNLAGSGSQIDLVHSGLLQVDQAVSAPGGGDIRLETIAGTSNADIQVAAPITATGGDGSIALAAYRDLIVGDTGATNDLYAAGLGTIDLRAGRDIRLGADVQIATARKSIRLAAGTSEADNVGAIVMDDRAKIISPNGPIRLLADGDITVGQIQTAGLANLASAFGAIIDGHASGGADIVAGRLVLSAAAGVGGDDPLETSVDTIAIENLKKGSIQIVNAPGRDLVIGVVDGLIGIHNLVAGETSITSGGALTVNSEVRSLNGGDIDLTSLAGDLTVNGRVHALGGGNLFLTSSRDLLINDTGDPADLKTERDGIISGYASRYVQFSSNVIAESGKGSISTLIPTLEKVFAPQVTAGGIAQVTETFGDPGSHNFTLYVDWGDGKVDVFKFDHPREFTAYHEYKQNPNGGNQAAPIGIRVTVLDDPNSQFVGGQQPPETFMLNATDSQTIVNGSSSVLVFTSAPGEGLGFFYVDTTLHTPPLLFPAPATLVYLFDDAAPIAGQSSSEVESSVVLREDVVQMRLVLLEPVDAAGAGAEPVELDEKVLDDLPKLFRRLPDGRYRLLVKEVGEERPRLLIDVTLRGGKPADDTEAGSDKPPTGELDESSAINVEKEEAAVPAVLPPGDDVPAATARRGTEVEGQAGPVQEAGLPPRAGMIVAVAAGSTVARRGLWRETVDGALSGTSPESFGKAARLARKVRRHFALSRDL